MDDSKREYGQPVIETVGDATELTLGRGTPVADVPGEPSGGYYDASRSDRADERYPGRQLDV